VQQRVVHTVYRRRIRDWNYFYNLRQKCNIEPHYS